MINEEEEEEDNNSKYIIEFLGEKYSKEFNIYKIIFLGSYGVGKTSIINKFREKYFDNEYEPTLSIEMKMIQVEVNNKIMQIQFWDSCGNEEFAKSVPNLFKNALLAILVYDINNKKSFKNLENWLNILKEKSFDNNIFLIGNKSDLINEREVQIEEGEKFKNNYNNIKKFFEVSTKDGVNINQLFEEIVISVYKKNENDEKIIDNEAKGTVLLSKRDLKKKRKKKENCC